MKMGLKLAAIAALASLAAAILPLAAQADVPGAHPGYLHALSDLRAARWNLEHRPGDAAVSEQEDIAISEIDRAIGEVQKAAVRDGKDTFVRPREDANLDRPGRLHHAVELLRAAHDDLKPGSITVGHTTLTDASRNRSQQAFERNPDADKAVFPDAIDPHMIVWRFTQGGTDIGAISWFPTHGTSLPNTNLLVSGDNKGYAAWA